MLTEGRVQFEARHLKIIFNAVNKREKLIKNISYLYLSYLYLYKLYLFTLTKIN